MSYGILMFDLAFPELEFEGVVAVDRQGYCVWYYDADTQAREHAARHAS